MKRGNETTAGQATTQQSPRVVDQALAPTAEPNKAAAIVEPSVSRGAESAAPASRRPPARSARDQIEVTVGLIPYGDVIIDGRKAGRAPVVVKLSPGAHRVVGRYQQLRRAQTVVVDADSHHFVLDLRDAEPQP